MTSGGSAVKSSAVKSNVWSLVGSSTSAGGFRRSRLSRSIGHPTNRHKLRTGTFQLGFAFGDVAASARALRPHELKFAVGEVALGACFQAQLVPASFPFPAFVLGCFALELGRRDPRET